MTRAAGACVLLVAAVAALAADGSGNQAILEEVLRQLQQGRAAAGAPPLERRGALDAAALDRANEIAALPESRRLALGDPIDRALKRHGVRYRRALQHVDLKHGYRSPGPAFARTWRDYAQGWASAMHAERDGIGLATVVADDGWRVLVAVLVDDLGKPPSARDLERATIASINRVRAEHGLAALEPSQRLGKVARAHSREMLRHGFFAHRSPSGSQPVDRIRAAGIVYRKLAENIQLNRARDPVGAAVESWMASPPHRGNILDPGFTHTGVGVAVADDGTAHFTQLFLRPAAATAPEPRPR